MTTDLATQPETRSGGGVPASDRERPSNPIRLLVVVPAYNEGPRLESVLKEIHHHRPDADLLVVDDGSSDDTEKRALGAGARVARHPFNLGYGAALETGYQYGCRGGYDLLVQLDGDGQHDPSLLEALVAPIIEDRADVAVGSRFLEPSGYRATGIRRMGSFIFGRLASWLTGRRITDPTSGFWAMNYKAFSALTGGVLPHDYPDADILIGLHYAGLRLVEVPVAMRSADGGDSMHAGLRPLYYVFKMLLSMFLALVGRRPNSV